MKLFKRGSAAPLNMPPMSVAAAATVIIAAGPFLPMLPHQHLVTLPFVRLIVVLGIVTILLLALGVAQRKPRAWWLAVGLVSALLSDPTPPDYLGMPGRFYVLLAAVLLLVVAGLTGLRGVHHPFAGGLAALSTTISTVLILQAGDDPDVNAITAVLTVLGAAVVVGLAGRLRPRLQPLSSDEVRARKVSERLAVTHIGSSVGSRDLRAVPLPSGSYVAMRVVGPIAVAGGDPLTQPGRTEAAIAEAVSLCNRNGVLPCFFQTRPELNDAYNRAGLRIVKFGEEAIIELADFDLASPRRANARHDLRRAQRAGLHPRMARASELDAASLAELRMVSDDWRRPQQLPEMGFSMGRMDDVVVDDVELVIAEDGNGRIHGFTSWRPMHEGVALDLIRRRTDGLTGATDLCILSMVEIAKQRGYKRISLGAVPARDAAADTKGNGLARLVRRWITGRGVAGYQYASLARFKNKFATRWESRGLALSAGPLAAPLTILALVALHSWMGRGTPAPWDELLKPAPAQRPPAAPGGHPPGAQPSVAPSSIS